MSKLQNMRDAIAANVMDGDTLVIDGFTHLICFAAGHEIIRQKRRDLTAVRLTPDLVYDQMLAAGCISKLVCSWSGNPGVGSLHALRRRVEAKAEEGDRIVLDEYSHFGLLSRLLAAANGLPFWTLDNFRGSDIGRHNDNIRSVICPYTGRELATVPALHPDVAIVHCQRADSEGNAQVWGLVGSMKEVAFASRRVIVVAEEIVDSELIRRDPNRTVVPGMVVNAVVHEPWGCHPSFVQGCYDRDNRFYVEWDEVCRERASVQAWLDKWVYGVSGRSEYLELLGAERVDSLRPEARLSGEVSYGY